MAATKSFRMSRSQQPYRLDKVRNAVIAIQTGLRRTKELIRRPIDAVGSQFCNHKLVIFESFYGKQYSDNPRAIYEYLCRHHPEFEMYWSVDKRCMQKFAEKGIPFVRRFSFKWLLLMLRARYWVTNSRMLIWIIRKPGHTVYLQTWHGTPLKKLVNDMDEVHIPYTTEQRYKKNFYLESRNWDYLVSPNAYSTEIFRRAFNFQGKLLETGYPRNDYLYTHNNSETITRLKQYYGIPSDKKVILYAPTWRDDQSYRIGQYKFELDLDLQKMQSEFGDDYVVILRMHYLVVENFDLSPYEGFAYDFSNEDIRELYLISDLLITDYSSVFFDYANLRRPIIFYTYDIEHYRDTLRGFYFNLEEEAPGPVVRTSDDVVEAIKEIEKNDFNVSEQFDAFYDRFCYLEDGQATRRVVENVFSV